MKVELPMCLLPIRLLMLANNVCHLQLLLVQRGGGGQSRNDDEDERKEICTINSLN